MTFYCHFCDKRCHHSCPDLHEWWCKDCNIVFREGTGDRCLDMIRFIHSNPDNSYYSLTVDFARDSTFLAKFRGPKQQDEPWEAYDHLPKSSMITYIYSAMQGVNPDNLYNKILTLITFS